VRVSFDMPEYTGNITGLGTTRILEAMRRSGSKSRFYQASSSEMFGSALPPQSETTIFQPQSPYAAAKLYAYWLTVNYREAYNVYGCNGILFNHESPRRGEIFVTRKITRAVAFILAGKQHKLFMGNLDAKRDWGFAPEYVEMMHLMLQQETPDDYVVGTGESYSVREFINTAFAYSGVEIEWTGDGIDTKGIVKSFESRWSYRLTPGEVLIEIDPRYFRPTEVDYLKADISKARRQLGWEPRVTFQDLVQVMIDYDLLQAGIIPPKKGIEAVKAKGFGWTNHEFSLVEALKNDIG